jgi:hypothetical protein
MATITSLRNAGETSEMINGNLRALWRNMCQYPIPTPSSINVVYDKERPTDEEKDLSGFRRFLCYTG